jgi:type IV secretory pathway TrbL component
MTKPKLWTYLAAGGALAVALSSAALGATVTDSNADSTNPAARAHSFTVSLPDKASSVASAVLGVLTGGSTPSTIASNGNATTEHATNTNANTNANTNKDETTDGNVSAGQETNPAATTGTKPGWGCGDDNHTHSGPPGRPGATMPPGCANAKSH